MQVRGRGGEGGVSQLCRGGGGGGGRVPGAPPPCRCSGWGSEANTRGGQSVPVGAWNILEMLGNSDTTPLNCALRNNQNAKFYVTCVLPQC